MQADTLPRGGRSILDRLAQVFILVDLPDIINSVAVEIHDGSRRGAEAVRRSLDDLDEVVGLTAVGHQPRLLEAQLVQR